MSVVVVPSGGLWHLISRTKSRRQKGLVFPKRREFRHGSQSTKAER
jgi:hypothetical protein